jgi:hypothetical protein
MTRASKKIGKTASPKRRLSLFPSFPRFFDGLADAEGEAREDAQN